MNDTPTPPSQNPTPQNQPTPPAAPSFWSRNSTTLIRLGIVAVIIIGAIIYSRTQTPTPSIKNPPSSSAPTPASPALPLASSDAKSPSTAADQKTTKQEVAPQTVPPRVSAGTITITAQRGNGYTHLARRALTAHLQSKPAATQLKPEHKIYIEDYLQKRLTKHTPLITGTEIVFAQTEIEQAIDRALKLNERQLQNLHKYTLRVKNL